MLIFTNLNVEQICWNPKKNSSSSSVPASLCLWGDAWRSALWKVKCVMTQCCDYSEKREENDDDNSDEGRLAEQ